MTDEADVRAMVAELRKHAEANQNLAPRMSAREFAAANTMIDLLTQVAALREQVASMKQRKDDAYLERNQVVAALAKTVLQSGGQTGIARTAIEGWSEDWHGCVYIELPTGQASWHYHDSQAYLFADLPPYNKHWDGHSTPEKYERLAAIEQVARQGEPTEEIAQLIERLNNAADHWYSKAADCDLLADARDALTRIGDEAAMWKAGCMNRDRDMDVIIRALGEDPDSYDRQWVHCNVAALVAKAAAPQVARQIPRERIDEALKPLPTSFWETPLSHQRLFLSMQQLIRELAAAPIDDQVAKIAAWAETPEGKATIADAIKCAEQDAERLIAARRFDPAALDKPYFYVNPASPAEPDCDAGAPTPDQVAKDE